MYNAFDVTGKTITFKFLNNLNNLYIYNFCIIEDIKI